MEENSPKKKWYFLDSRAVSNLLVVLIGILFYMALANIGALQSKVDSLLGVLSPFIAGFAIAYLLNTPMDSLNGVSFTALSASVPSQS